MKISIENNENLIFNKNFSISTKIFFLTKLSTFRKKFYFGPKFQFLQKVFCFYQYFYFWQNFRYFTKISFFYQNFNFLPKFQFFTKISIFWPQFQFLTKISIFDQNFGFLAKISENVCFCCMHKYTLYLYKASWVCQVWKFLNKTWNFDFFHYFVYLEIYIDTSSNKIHFIFLAWVGLSIGPWKKTFKFYWRTII